MVVVLVKMVGVINGQHSMRLTWQKSNFQSEGVKVSAWWLYKMQISNIFTFVGAALIQPAKCLSCVTKFYLQAVFKFHNIEFSHTALRVWLSFPHWGFEATWVLDCVCVLCVLSTLRVCSHPSFPRLQCIELFTSLQCLQLRLCVLVCVLVRVCVCVLVRVLVCVRMRLRGCHWVFPHCNAMRGLSGKLSYSSATCESHAGASIVFVVMSNSL